MEVSLCSDIQYAAESNCSALSSGAKLSGENINIGKSGQPSLVQCEDRKFQKSTTVSVDVDNACDEQIEIRQVIKAQELQSVSGESILATHSPGNFNFQRSKDRSNTAQSNDDSTLVSSHLGNLVRLKHIREPLSATASLSFSTPNMESSSQNLGEILNSENCMNMDEFLPHDCTVALWVKWRGKWQIGIRCLAEDCPLQTLKEKPTPEGKGYICIFFPHSRTYYWADAQLVCSVEEMPEPLAYGTHLNWLELANDLSSPRRFMMEKLTVAMLNISDKLHIEAVDQSARVASFWKEFAKEASCCKSYSDLGKMLLKLQKIILPRYINPDWSTDSFSSWEQQCLSAETAEAVELLTKELSNSVVLSNVEEFGDAHSQSELGFEWKVWKQEALQLFTGLLPTCCGDLEPQHFDVSVNIDAERSQKRPRVDRSERHMHGAKADVHLIEMNSKIEQTCKEELRSGSLSSSTCNPQENTVSQDVTDYCDDISVKHATIVNGSDKMQAMSADGEPKKKYRRCLAFMEARGKQCGRWASDGSNYCCSHEGSSSKTNILILESPIATMCMGTTTSGSKCKHRAQHGSSFCKKHHGRRSKILERVGLDRKIENNCHLDDISNSNGECSSRILSIGDVQTNFEDDLVQVMVGETLEEGNRLMNIHELYSALPAPSTVSSNGISLCIGSKSKHYNISGQCQENATRYTLYCEQHLPRFLKRAKGGRTRFISKEVFVELLKCCSSRREKLLLHQACETLHNYLKSVFSSEVVVSKGDCLNWILSEASKEPLVGEYLLKLVSTERQKLGSLWGFDSIVTAAMELDGCHTNHMVILSIKCKICAEEFKDEQTLCAHWMSIHKKEAKRLFRGYACAICMNSFTGRKLLESHINDRHGVQFLQHSILFRCMSCNSHFPSPGKLWEHVLSFHSLDFRLPTQPYDQPCLLSNKKMGGGKLHSESTGNGAENFLCGLCSMKFELLTDMECHYQSVHMNPTSTSFVPPKYKQHLKANKHYHPRHKIGVRPAFRSKNSASHGLKKHFQASSSVIAARLRMQTQASETFGLGRLTEAQCSFVAQRLFEEIHRTKPQPNNSEIISIARSACCATYIQNAIIKQYGTAPESLYLKAARLCSELNMLISWHLEGFTCPRACEPLRKPQSLAPLVSLPIDFRELSTIPSDFVDKGGKEVDGCHFVISPRHLNKSNFFVLCHDISFGKELVPVACVVDVGLTHLLETSGYEASHTDRRNPMPWQSFHYATERLLCSSLHFDARSSQLGCACLGKCQSKDCDHVYLFNDDYENAKDVTGSSMKGKFPYDERDRIQLKEGYPIYECNFMCHCDRTCQNRRLQNGMQVRLEIFRTEKKGWAVRARETIARGTFVCEYIGEVVDVTEANDRAQRYGNSCCKFLFDITALANDLGQLCEAETHYIIDATNFGNVSRFINHSCSPNLASYLVLVESMECQLAHVGLYANKDIAEGEELVFNYRFNPSLGDQCPCYCGSSNCRGYL